LSAGVSGRTSRRIGADQIEQGVEEPADGAQLALGLGGRGLRFRLRRLFAFLVRVQFRRQLILAGLQPGHGGNVRCVADGGRWLARRQAELRCLGGGVGGRLAGWARIVAFAAGRRRGSAAGDGGRRFPARCQAARRLGRELRRRFGFGGAGRAAGRQQEVGDDEVSLVDGHVGGGLAGGVLGFQLGALLDGRLDAGHVVDLDRLEQFQGGAGERRFLGRPGGGCGAADAKQVGDEAEQPDGCTKPLPAGGRRPV